MMKHPPHPGELLREDVLVELGLSVKDAAERLGMSRVALSRVLHGHAAIRPSLAIRLERAGVGTARAWLAMQAHYDLAQALEQEQPPVRRLLKAGLTPAAPAPGPSRAPPLPSSAHQRSPAPAKAVAWPTGVHCPNSNR